MDNRGHGIRGTQHCWTMDGNKHKINIQGLYPDNTYRYIFLKVDVFKEVERFPYVNIIYGFSNKIAIVAYKHQLLGIAV